MKRTELTRLLELEEWTPDDERIALNLVENKRIYLAEHIQKYDGIIIDLSHDKSAAVRKAVASNKNTPIPILKKLSTSDENATVRNRASLTLKEQDE